MANGVDDSSTLCVTPVFDKIIQTVETQNLFLTILNTRFNAKIPLQSSPWKTICYGKPTKLHRGESRFKAPTSKLTWLINNLFGNTSLIGRIHSKNPITKEKRIALLSGDENIRREAIDAIMAHRQERWMVFEGATAPDVCIQTKDFVIVIEGKQTEGKRTTETCWGAERDQLIRHMDAFLDDPTRNVYGLFIYEDNKTAHYNFAEYKSETIFHNSLIHRDRLLIKKAKSGFLGALTWDELASKFGAVVKHKTKQK